ncbi:uncharacterized protein [Diadema antillarum]|uniref:uncharacterized protein n=1 Tax=Diadema antillarum TaxID=105358 RepID=UPI003A886EE9
MKKGRSQPSGRDARVYMNLVLPKKAGEEYGTRPYGGRKGISNHYPPSINAFSSDRPTDFLCDVKEMVFRQMEVDNKHGVSPHWISKYNKEQNHTGEQPLMVQRFLGSNKQEQQDGVLPVYQKSQSRFHVERSDEGGEREYQQGLSLHQYLTATEMPGQSEKLVDIRHGRPTRTSLLRARHRSRSAPGPEKAKLEIRDDIHFLQEQALKREEKYKSVDVPDDLQPLTEEGETVHQFLVGARYNRSYYRDSKCYNKVGLYVSRDNPQHCFLKPGTNQESLLGHKGEKERKIAGHSEVSASEPNSLCQSTSSLHSRSHLQPPAKARQAWGTSGSIASAPSPTPNESRESFFTVSTRNEPLPRSAVPGSEPFAGPATPGNERDQKSRLMEDSGMLQTKPIQFGSSTPQQRSTTSLTRSGVSSCDSCVLCQEGAAVKSGVPVHFHGRNIKSAPNRRKWTHGVTRGRYSDEPEHCHGQRNSRKEAGDLMLVQQYHLRILGTQMNMMQDKGHSPQSKVHYSPKQSGVTRPKTAAKSGRRSSLKGRNRNNNNKSKPEAAVAETSAEGMKEDVAANNKISVHIDGVSGGDEKMDSPHTEGDADPTPRSQEVVVGSPREDKERLIEMEPEEKEKDVEEGEEQCNQEEADNQNVQSEHQEEAATPIEGAAAISQDTAPAPSAEEGAGEGREDEGLLVSEMEEMTVGELEEEPRGQDGGETAASMEVTEGEMVPKGEEATLEDLNNNALPTPGGEDVVGKGDVSGGQEEVSHSNQDPDVER